MSLEKPDEPAWLERVFAPPARRLTLLREVWPVVVGPELAARTEVLGLEGDTLRVRVQGPTWQRALHRLQRDLLIRLRRVTGRLAPRRLGYLQGAVADVRPPEPVATPDPPVPEAVAEAARVIPDPEIRGRFERSAAAYVARFARAERKRPHA